MKRSEFTVGKSRLKGPQSGKFSSAPFNRMDCRSLADTKWMEMNARGVVDEGTDLLKQSRHTWREIKPQL